MKTMKEVLYIHTYGQGGGRGWELVGLSSLDILTQIFFIVVSSIKMSTLKQIIPSEMEVAPHPQNS